MARTNYQRGYEIERKIVHELTEQGFLVLRSAGSHGKVDVLGLRKDKIVAVQSKRTKQFSMAAYTKEIQAIQEILRQYDLPQVDFQFWVWTDRKGFRKWRVNKDAVRELSNG